MPRNIVLDKEAVETLEQGGGLKADTVKTREQHFRHLEAYVLEAEPNTKVEVLLESEEGCKRLEELIGLFFYSLRVTAKDDGSEKLPKRGYALKIHSNLKCFIMEQFRVDITDPILFPNSSRKWKSFINEFVVNNRSETEHHEEIDPTTMVGITQLIMDVVDALEARGTESYQEKLSKIPFEWQDKLNRILQDGVQFILPLYEVRRGKEGLELLKKKDFIIFEDSVFDFKYVRKILSEAEKNQPEGSNSYCHGVIPFKILTGRFNPGQIVSFYLSLLPKGDDCALFPQSRDKSKKFNPHNGSDMMYEEKRTVGKNNFSKMLPILCEIIGRPRQTNHCIRSTAICYMRRAGMSWEIIIKVTGHRSTVTLVKNYDLKLEAPGLHEISHAIGTGQLVAMGEKAELVGLEPRRKRSAMIAGDGVITVEDEETPATKSSRPAPEDAAVSAETSSSAPNTSLVLRPAMTSSYMAGMMMNPSSGPAMNSSYMAGMGMNPSSGSSRSKDPSFILMESAGRFVGNLGKSIMEGAAPLLENLLKANREQHLQVMFQRGNMDTEKLEVSQKTITKSNRLVEVSSTTSTKKIFLI